MSRTTYTIAKCNAYGPEISCVFSASSLSSGSCFSFWLSGPGIKLRQLRLIMSWSVSTMYEGGSDDCSTTSPWSRSGSIQTMEFGCVCNKSDAEYLFSWSLFCRNVGQLPRLQTRDGFKIDSKIVRGTHWKFNLVQNRLRFCHEQSLRDLTFSIVYDSYVTCN